MNIFSTAIVVLLLGAAGAAIYVRLAPVNITDTSQLPKNGPGDYALEGGHYAVRPLETVDLTALEAQIAATARTKPVSGSAGDLPMVFVHRSLVWGFPDVTHVWVEADNVHIHSHLVYGKGDLGVNRKRMQTWFDKLGL